MRKSGILMHISSLPSEFGIGKLGDSAYMFANFLRDCGVQVWQILPLSPTSSMSSSTLTVLSSVTRTIRSRREANTHGSVNH